LRRENNRQDSQKMKVMMRRQDKRMNFETLRPKVLSKGGFSVMTFFHDCHDRHDSEKRALILNNYRHDL
jgi:hypothetical protein